MYYQPQVDKDGSVNGFEALIRWNHPDKGLVPPESFIPILESGGLILPISDWIIRHCCAQVAHWTKTGFWQPDWQLSINVSPLQFYQENFIKLLQLSVMDAEISCSDICIEITEAVAIENIEFTAKRLKDIRTLGIRVALDDFGTGYSSMSYLKDLPIDVLKMDRSYIKSLPNSEKDRKVMRAIVDIAAILQLTVMAEGVETQEQLQLAAEIGCHYYQGYYFYKPVPAADLVESFSA